MDIKSVITIYNKYSILWYFFVLILYSYVVKRTLNIMKDYTFIEFAKRHTLAQDTLEQEYMVQVEKKNKERNN